MARRGQWLVIEWAAEDTVAALQARYRRERRRDVRPRLHGLWLVRQGQTTRAVAQVLGVHERTVQCRAEARSWAAAQRYADLLEAPGEWRAASGVAPS